MNAKKIAVGALTGALYTVLTLVTAPIAFTVFQLRVSEALCVMPFFTGSAVPGLFIGCAAANFLAGAPLLDVVFGSLASLIAAWLTYWFAKKGYSKWLAPLPAVVANGIIIGILQRYVYGVELPLIACMALIAVEQAIVCYALGMPLLAFFKKNERFFN